MTNIELDKLNEGRTLRLAMPVLLRMYSNKRESAVARLLSEYRIGGKLEPLVAEVGVYQSLIDELHRRSKEIEILETKRQQS